MTADEFVARLMEHRSEEELRKVQRYFKSGDDFIGVRMGQVFALAQEFVEMAPDEIEKLLESPIHEARAGALSSMGKQATRRRTTARACSRSWTATRRRCRVPRCATRSSTSTRNRRPTTWASSAPRSSARAE